MRVGTLRSQVHWLIDWLMSCPLNSPFSSKVYSIHIMHACAHMMLPGEVVPHVVPPLPQPAEHQKYPRQHPNPGSDNNQLSSSTHPSSRPFHFLVDPIQYHTDGYPVQTPSEVIIQRHMVMAHCVLPGTLKNYTAGLSCFTKFCNDFSIPKLDCIPASQFLLSSFVTMRGARSVWKAAIKPWLLSVEILIWHHINSAPWHGGAEISRCIKGVARLAPSTSHHGRHNPVTIEHIHALCCDLDLTNSFDIAIFAVTCMAFGAAAGIPYWIYHCVMLTVIQVMQVAYRFQI